MEILQMIMDIFNHLKLFNRIKYLLSGPFLGLFVAYPSKVLLRSLSPHFLLILFTSLLLSRHVRKPRRFLIIMPEVAAVFEGIWIMRPCHMGSVPNNSLIHGQRIVKVFQKQFNARYQACNH